MKPEKRSRNTEQNYRRNVLANLGDAAFVEASNGMTPLGTIIASLLWYLTPSKTIISLVGTLSNIVQFIPQLWAAKRMERSRELKPLLLYYSGGQRFIWFLLAAMVLWVIPWSSNIFIPAFIIGYGIYGYYVGQASLVWINYLAKMVPPNNFGKFLGFRAALGSAAAIGGAFLSGYVLVKFQFPVNYAVIFGLTGVLGVLSFFCLGSTIENIGAPVPVKPQPEMFWRRAFLIARHDRNFQAYLLATVLITVGKMPFTFQVIYAQEKIGITIGQVGLASVALMVGQTLGYLCWGWLTGHTSFKTTIVLSTFFFLPSLALTFWMANAWILYTAVAIFAFSQSARNFGENGLMMEICCAEEKYPIYIGLRNALMGPFFALSVFLGGVLTDLLGYRPVLIISVPLVIIGGIVNWSMVKTREPSPEISIG
jgi:MFS family permease